MSRSLMNRLPDILARAAVRASEAMHALGVRPGHSTMAWSTRQPTHARACASEQPDHESVRFQTGHDLALLLNSLIISPQRPSLRGQVGFLWLRSEPSQDLAEATANQAGTAAASELALSQAWLGDLAMRLFVARELLAPSALLALTPAAGMGPCIPLMLKTVLDCDLSRVTTGVHGAGPSVFVCRKASTPGARSALVSRLHSPSLAQCLRDTQSMGRTALIMRPGPGILELQSAWQGEWLFTDPAPETTRALRGQLHQLAWDRPPLNANRGVREAVAAWG